MSLRHTIERLTRASLRQHKAPDAYIAFPDELPEDAWCTSPELVSLHGTTTWEGLDEAARKRVAFFEAVSFYSLNIHGERMLMEGVSARLYRPGLEEITPYLHHLLDEENKHSLYFGGFCQRYAGKIYPDRKVAVPREETSRAEEDLLFFAKVMVFEEIVDAYNVAMAKDERLAGVVREINRNHHLEEARHLAFGRAVVRHLWEEGDWDDEATARIREHLDGFLLAAWHEYYNPLVYADAGLSEPWALREEAWGCEAQRRHRAAYSAPVVDHLTAQGLLGEPPSWLS